MAVVFSRSEPVHLISKPSANYRASTSDHEVCTSCIHIESHDSAPFTCQIVGGTVDSYHVCNLWEGKRSLQVRVGPEGYIHGWIKVGGAPDKTKSYLKRDLHKEGEWPSGHNPRYGAVTFNHEGKVLLREPTNHFDGYHWTFPKGGPDKGEHPVDVALRETMEETGHAPKIVGHVPGAFKGGTAGSTNHFYLAEDTKGQVDKTAMDANGETNALQWASPKEALNLISKSTNLQGRYRDLQTLQAAYEAYGKVHPEMNFPKITLPPPPPKPPKYFKKNIFRPGDPDPVPKVSFSKPVKAGSTPGSSIIHYKKSIAKAPKWVTTKGPKTAAADEAFGKRWDETDYEFRDSEHGHHVSGTSYHWKHGYIPLDSFADQQLAKKEIDPQHKSVYKAAATHSYAEAEKHSQHLTSTQLAAKAAPHYAKGKKAHAAGDQQKAAEELGAAHGLMEASKQQKAAEKAGSASPVKAKAAPKIQTPEAKQDAAIKKWGAIGGHLKVSANDKKLIATALHDRGTPSKDWMYRGAGVDTVPSPGDQMNFGLTSGSPDMQNAYPYAENIEEGQHPVLYSFPIGTNSLDISKYTEVPEGEHLLSGKFQVTTVNTDPDGITHVLLAPTFSKAAAPSTSAATHDAEYDKAFASHKDDQYKIVTELLNSGSDPATFHATIPEYMSKAKSHHASGGHSTEAIYAGAATGQQQALNDFAAKPVPHETAAYKEKFRKNEKEQYTVASKQLANGKPASEIESFLKYYKEQVPVEHEKGLHESEAVFAGAVSGSQKALNEHYASHDDQLESLLTEEHTIKNPNSGPIDKVTMENHDGNHNKFYESSVIANPDGTATHQTKWGSLNPGAKTFGNMHTYKNTDEALTAHGLVMGQKVKKGYSITDTHPEFTSDNELAAATAAVPSVSKPNVTSDGMPHTEADLAGATKINGPTGSNPAQWYQMPDGSQFIVKKTPDADHAYNEVAVGQTYKAAGLPVPDVSVVKMDDGSYAVASKKVNGLDAWQTTSANQADARKGFGVDALTSNYDALGLVADNAFTNSFGKVVRIDNGGGGFYRAQGAEKPAFAVGKWDANPAKADYNTLRDHNMSEQGAQFYGAPKGMHDDEMAASLASASNLDLVDVRQRMSEAGIPKAFRDKYIAVLKDRQNHIKLLAALKHPTATPSTSAAKPSMDLKLGAFNKGYEETKHKLANNYQSPEQVKNDIALGNTMGSDLSLSYAQGSQKALNEHEESFLSPTNPYHSQYVDKGYKDTKAKFANLETDLEGAKLLYQDESDPAYKEGIKKAIDEHEGRKTTPAVVVPPAVQPKTPESVMAVHSPSYKTGYTQGLTEGHNATHLTPTQLSAKAAPHYSKAKKALAANDNQTHASELGMAHGYAQASKDAKAKPQPKDLKPTLPNASDLTPAAAVGSKSSKTVSSVMAKNLNPGDVIKTGPNEYMKVAMSPHGVTPGSVYGAKAYSNGTIDNEAFSVPAPNGGQEKFQKLTPNHPLMKSLKPDYNGPTQEEVPVSSLKQNDQILYNDMNSGTITHYKVESNPDEDGVVELNDPNGEGMNPNLPIEDDDGNEIWVTKISPGHPQYDMAQHVGAAPIAVKTGTGKVRVIPPKKAGFAPPKPVAKKSISTPAATPHGVKLAPIKKDTSSGLIVDAPGYSVKHGKLADLSKLQKEGYDSAYVIGYNQAMDAIKKDGYTPSDVYATVQEHNKQVLALPPTSVEGSEHAGVAKGAHQAAFEAQNGITLEKKAPGFKPANIGQSAEDKAIVHASASDDAEVGTAAHPIQKKYLSAVSTWTSNYRLKQQGPQDWLDELNKSAAGLPLTPPGHANKMQTNAQNILAGAEKYAKPEPKQIYRGMSMDEALFKKLYGQYDPGDEISLPLQSFSHNSNPPDFGDGPIKIIVHMAKGAQAWNIIPWGVGSENEVLSGGTVVLDKIVTKPSVNYGTVRHVYVTQKDWYAI